MLAIRNECGREPDRRKLIAGINRSKDWRDVGALKREETEGIRRTISKIVYSRIGSQAGEQDGQVDAFRELTTGLETQRELVTEVQRILVDEHSGAVGRIVKGVIGVTS